jgi:hypothetical protein
MLAAVCLLGMGAACVLAGLLSELMIRQNQTLAAPSGIVVDTNSALPQLQLADQYRRSQATAEHGKLLAV